MFFLDNSFMIYSIIFLLLVLVFLYIWRRLQAMESHNRILENKVKSLKKENFDLQKVLSEDTNEKVSMDDAEILMNNIFNNKEESIIDVVICTDEKCTVQKHKNEESDIQIKYEDTPPPPQIPVINHQQESSNVVVQNVVDNEELESIVSENTTSPYNRKKLMKLNLDKLKEIAVSLNLSTDGTKNAIIDRILA